MPWYGGHPWNYYGPSISLGFFFGNAGWWHGNYFSGGYRWVGGARVYNNIHIRDTYQGGQFRGRDYVAPPERGGYYPNRTTAQTRQHPARRSSSSLTARAEP